MCEIEPDMVREVVEENNRLTKENEDLVLSDDYKGRKIKELAREIETLKASLLIAGHQRDSWMDSNARRTEECDRLRGTIKIIFDNSINPDHTMTLLGLTEVVDANFKIAAAALNHKEG